MGKNKNTWFDIYYGIVSKKSGISKLNLIQLELNLGYVPEECYITTELIETIDNILNKKNKSDKK